MSSRSGGAVVTKTSPNKSRGLNMSGQQQHQVNGRKIKPEPPAPPPPSQPEEQSAVVPDSTTSTEREMSEFAVGMDVLLKQKDGRYYLGTVVEVDAIREQCLVRFGDDTDSWSGYRDLTKLSTPEQEDLLCVVCKKSAPKKKNEIGVCDKCGRGYHSRCHQPEIPVVCLKEGATWMCKRCTDSESHRLRRGEPKQLRRDTLRNSNGVPAYGTEKQVATSSCSKVLSYDLDSLTWDTYHRSNVEQQYCYCGSAGEWYRQMLQCGRCKQWYHEKCLDCCQYPLYAGDRFYVFVCAVCNHGSEFLRRMEMKWVDLVHLMLFNLTVYHSKKYYDLDTVIIPYINDNWHALQLPPKISMISKSDRRENILSVLTNNRNRFKCGREIKKRTTIWGLRVRLPPPEPTVTLPANGFITEQQLRSLWQGNRRLQFMPSESKATGSKIIPSDNHMVNVMMGTAYQQTSTFSETDSPCPSPEVEDRESDAGQRVAFKPEYLGAGCAKKSVPFPKMSLQRRKKLLSLNQDRRKLLRKTKRRLAVVEKSVAVKRKQPPKADKKAVVDKSTETLPLTPPTSVSAPPTPPARSCSLSDLSNDFSEHSNNNCKKELEPNTPCDTSGDDETSSKSTLDLIIPPPKDFEGKNNPFLTLLTRGIGDAKSKKGRRKDSITLPLPLTAVIPGKPAAPVMRPTKRQLSEKDIVIGPNGEVKRRRLRRARLSSVGSGQTASKTATVVPARVSDAKDWGAQTTSSGSTTTTAADYGTFSNGRRLRQRPDKEKPAEAQAAPQPPPKPSPVKQEPDIRMDDLKSSLSSYFGAKHRIAVGERFTVKGKRVGPNGKVEYLIDWEGPVNGMT